MWGQGGGKRRLSFNVQVGMMVESTFTLAGLSANGRKYQEGWPHGVGGLSEGTRMARLSGTQSVPSNPCVSVTLNTCTWT